MIERPQAVDGIPMRTFTAAHTDVQLRMAEKVARYMAMGLKRGEACRLANVSRQWSYDHDDLVQQARKVRKAS